MKYVRTFWAIEYTSCPLDRFRKNLGGCLEPPRTKLFASRQEARDWLAAYKSDPKRNWTIMGGYACEGRGNRIYKSIRPVKVQVTVEVA